MAAELIADEQECEVCFQCVPTPAAHVDRATVLCAACALARLERRMRGVAVRAA
jgi:hypothetical protein